MLSRFSHLISQRKGQIQLQHEIGKWIYLLAALRENQIFVDIGCWNGRGSTRILYLGNKAKAKKDWKIIALEINEKKFLRAKKEYSSTPNIKIFHGRIIDQQDLDNSDLSEDEKLWFEQDVTNMKKVPNLFNDMPSAIDVLILDGGEFSTYSEYLLLFKRSKWIVLDDTNTRKNTKVRKHLFANPWRNHQSDHRSCRSPESLPLCGEQPCLSSRHLGSTGRPTTISVLAGCGIYYHHT